MTLTKINILMDYNILRPSPKIILKVLILGDSAVGKTSLIERISSSKFNPKYNMTIGVNLRAKTIPVNNNHEGILIFSDVAGQKRFEKIRRAFYIGTDVVVAVCDLTRKMTLDNLENIWIPEFLSTNTWKKKLGKTKIILVGNKCDLENLTVISTGDLEETAERINRKYPKVSILLPCLRTSARDNISIEEIFHKIRINNPASKN